jgi:hypothetical protein
MLEEDDVEITNINLFDLCRLGIYEGEFDGIGRPVGWLVSLHFDPYVLPKDLYNAVSSGATPLRITKNEVLVYGISVPRLNIMMEIARKKAMIQTMEQEVTMLINSLRELTKRRPLFDDED